MAVTEYHCTESVDDAQTGDGASTTTTVAIAQHNNTTVTESEMRADIDTSGLSGETITAATLYWYGNVASTKSKDASWYHQIAIIGGSIIYANTSGAEPAGWSSHALTAGEIAELNMSGDTGFNFSVPDPGSTYHRTWPLRQWDHTPTGDYSVYLEVTTLDARRRKIILV